MMRIGEPGNAIILLAVSATLSAQSDSGAPDVRHIVQSSIAATQRHWQTRLQYTYVERDHVQRRDSDGRLTSEDVDVWRTILVNRVPFEQLVERNGQPPSAEQERKQNEKLDKLKRETPQQRAERLRKQAEENASLVQEVPKAFEFRLLGEDVVKGRPAWVLHATPHPGYQAQGKYGKMFSKVAGRLWIDKQDLGWIKVDGEVIQPFSMGLFLVRLLRGSEIKMEQTRVDQTWMPERVQVRAAAKIFLVKSLVINRLLTYSEYRLAKAGAPTTRDPANP